MFLYNRINEISNTETFHLCAIYQDATYLVSPDPLVPSKELKNKKCKAKRRKDTEDKYQFVAVYVNVSDYSVNYFSDEIKTFCAK